MFKYGIVVILAIVTFALASAVDFRDCENTEGTVIKCTIHDVRIDGCQDGPDEKLCRIKIGTNATISYDYTTNFEATKLESSAFWVNSVVNLPFVTLERNACKSTACPTTPGQKQTYTIGLPILKIYPARTYDVQWKLTDANTHAKQGCCFQFDLKLYK